jgi:hypothetical protein
VPSFLHELRRRQIFKAVVVYFVIAWLFTQIGAATFPVMRLPEWTLDALIVLLALAFPVAMFIAWTAEDRARKAAATEAAKPPE